MISRFTRSLFAMCLGLVFLTPAARSQTPDVGGGSPTQSITQAFLDAYYRNGFNRLVAVPPLADVKKFGTIGLVQEFQDAAKTTSVRLALIKPNASVSIPENAIGVYQLQAVIYAYYNTVGVNNAGYPASDTMPCPTLVSATAAGNSCQYQLFDKPYVLFVYSSLGQLLSSTVSIRDPFYTRWTAQGGINVFGPPISAEASVTGGVNGGVSTSEAFDRGVIFNVTSGSLIGRVLSVKGDIYSVYFANGGVTGSLGYPVGDEILLANGHYRQSFEGGSIEYDPATSGSGVLRTPVSNIRLTPANISLRLNLGDTYTVAASLFSATGISLTDRQPVFTTSNSRVITVQSTGLSATLRAVGGGSASVTATAEGKTSAAITIFVSAPCCQIGEGGPTAATQQAFADAVTRNKLQIKLPAASAVVRLAAGYLQELQTADGRTVLVIVPAKSLSGFVVAGSILTRYLDLGGPSGPLGLPSSDATAAGRQNFDGGALAGTPVQLVSGGILAKWASLGYETGILGLPSGPASSFLTFRATSVTSQAFAHGEIDLANSGSLAGKAFVVTGITQASLQSNGGIAGSLGAPIADEIGVNSRRRQDFEGGSIDYAPGDALANATLTPRKPLVSATPTTVLAGTTLRLAIGGFDANAIVRVSTPGRPDFLITTATGAYVWDVYIPATAATSTVTVTATQPSGGATAQASYAIRSIADSRFTLAVVRGDGQSGTPGASLGEVFRVSLKDQSGNPAAGQLVTFAASPGASIAPVTAVTDANGEATATLRLPAIEGLALATATAAHQSVTFSARAASSRLSNFPKLTQAYDQALGTGTATIRQKGALLSAFASMLRYYQDRGDAPLSNGAADPLSLNAFLRTLCPADTQGAAACDGFYTAADSAEQIVNPWRVPAFVGNSVDVAVSSLASANPLALTRDLISQGTPVLIPLALSASGAPQGSHYVVATGVEADGGLSIFDPNPVYGRALLNDYLTGFPNNGQTITATLSGAPLYFLLQPFSAAFLVTSNGSVSISSLSGTCPAGFQIFDTTAVPGSAPPSTPRPLFFTACTGIDAAYQIEIAQPAAGTLAATFRDLGNPGNRVNLTAAAGGISKLAQRSGSQWSLTDLAPGFPVEGVVNSASGIADFSPGGILTIYGSGFGSDPAVTRVEAGSVAARIVSVNPFQINAQLPETTPIGPMTLRVTTPNGIFERTIVIKSVSPGIFTFPGQPAITNQNGSLNRPGLPANRGEAIVIYSTGLGVTTAQGNLRPAASTVKVQLGNQELTPFYAGATPGIPGLYQVNVIIPAPTPPGLAVPLFLKQGASNSNSVPLAIQ